MININIKTTSLPNNKYTKNFQNICESSKECFEEISSIVNNGNQTYFSLGHGGKLQFIIPEFIIADIETNNTHWDVISYDLMEIDTTIENNKYFCDVLLERYNMVSQNITVHQMSKFVPLIDGTNCSQYIDELTSWIKDPSEKELKINNLKEKFGVSFDLMELVGYDSGNAQKYADLIIEEKKDLTEFSYKWIKEDGLVNLLKDDLFDECYYFFNKLNQSTKQIYMYFGFYGSGSVIGEWYWSSYNIGHIIAKLYPNLAIIGSDGFLFNNKKTRYECANHINFAINML